VAGATLELDDRAWEPARTKLAIYEAPEVQAEDMGLGRGWGTVTRSGEDVTSKVIESARASVQRFKDEVLSHGRMTLAEVVELAGVSHPQAKVSDRLALAEQSVWALLHEGRLTLHGPGGPVERAQWEPVLLRWESWSDAATAVKRAG
jgi:hypothetical protein